MRITIILAILLLVSSTALSEKGNSVKYQVADQTYEGYYVSAKDKAPLILMIHDWDGLTGYEKKRAHMLLELGYDVFAADMFGAGVRPEETAEKRKLTGELYQDREKMHMLIKGALKEAKNLGADIDNAVAIGYCFGGTVVLEAARAGMNLKAFVTFHGGLETPEGQNYSDAKGEIMVFHGTADSAVTIGQFAALAKELESAGIPHEMTTYGGADHAFTVFGGSRYDEQADKRSWNRFVEYLKNSFHRK